jgi:hypothetical protein
MMSSLAAIVTGSHGVRAASQLPQARELTTTNTQLFKNVDEISHRQDGRLHRQARSFYRLF